MEREHLVEELMNPKAIEAQAIKEVEEFGVCQISLFGHIIKQLIKI